MLRVAHTEGELEVVRGDPQDAAFVALCRLALIYGEPLVKLLREIARSLR